MKEYIEVNSGSGKCLIYEIQAHAKEGWELVCTNGIDGAILGRDAVPVHEVAPKLYMSGGNEVEIVGKTSDIAEIMHTISPESFVGNTVTNDTNTGNGWSEERKKAFGEKMKAAREAKKKE